MTKTKWFALVLVVLAFLLFLLAVFPEQVFERLRYLRDLDQESRKVLAEWVTIVSGVLGSAAVIAGVLNWIFKGKPPEPAPVSDIVDPSLPPPERTPDRLEEFYYQDLTDQCQRYDLEPYRSGQARSEGPSVRAGLSDMYVDLEVDPVEDASADPGRRRERKAGVGPDMDDKRPPLLLLDVLQEQESHRMVLRGDVGSGKSSFINFLCQAVAVGGRATPASRRAAPEDRVPQHWLRRPVVRLLLREIGSKIRPDEPRQSDRLLLRVIRGDLARHIENRLNQDRGGDEEPIRLARPEIDALWERFKPAFLREGVLILDGLDEVSGGDQHDTPDADTDTAAAPTPAGDRRKTLLDALRAFAGKPGHAGVSILLTSRNQAYRGDDALSGFKLYQLRGIGPERLPVFVRHWYRQAARGLEQREFNTERAEALIGQIGMRPSLRALTGTPLLLTLILVLDSSNIRLPDSRAELYREAVSLLLQRWHRQLLQFKASLSLQERQALEILELDPDLLETAMKRLALRTLRESADRRSAGEDRIVFSSALVEQELKKQLQQRHLGFEAQDSCHYFLRFRSQLLVALGEDLSFVHKSFHEYLAARLIMDQSISRLQTLRENTATPETRDWWREVFLFALNIGKAEFAAEFMARWVLCRQPDRLQEGELEDHLAIVGLCSHAALENRLPQAIEQDEENDSLQQTYRDLQAYLDRLTADHRLGLEQRAGLARARARFGDPRPGVALKRDRKGLTLRRQTKARSFPLPDLDLVEIPPGAFLMGSTDQDGDAYSDEKPAHEVRFEHPFFITRYPVTNAQYSCFVEAGGYEDDALWGRLPEAARRWREGGQADLTLLDGIADKDNREGYRRWLLEDQVRHQPRFWDQPRWNLTNHPVVGVSWYEALAYCAWLYGIRERIWPGGLADRGEFRLPSEAEWEYAARGREDWRYAWGKDPDKTLGNYQDTGIGRTTAVGLFPPGRAFDLHDMSGNVWEWTTSRWGGKFEEPDFTYERWEEPNATRNDLNYTELRIIRGGSWVGAPVGVRCAVHSRDPPYGRDGTLGFRVVW